jgi:hypothetical protein
MKRDYDAVSDGNEVTVPNVDCSGKLRLKLRSTEYSIESELAFASAI